MKKLCLFLTAFIGIRALSQNVGIGTNTPQAPLHVFNTSSAFVLSETNGSSQYSGFEAKTNGGVNDRLLLRKNMPAASGSIAGINLDNLSMVVTGAQAGALMIGVITANPIYFTTANTERMRLTADGKLGINDNAPAALFSVKGRSDQAVTASFVDVTTTSQRTAVTGYINSNGAGSAGVVGATQEGVGTSPLESFTYGVVGTSGYGGIGLAGYSISSTALRGKSQSGFSLYTSGKVRLDGIGEGAGKVLTSNASGDATWQAMPSGSGAWTVNGNNIYNTNTGLVGINTPTPTARMHINNPTSDTIPFLISTAGGRITRINGVRELYNEGDIWVNSAYGRLRLGYSDKGWYWGTINGGQDLQLWSHSTTDLSASGVNRMYFDGSTGNIGINTNNAPAVYGKFIVDRNADMNGSLGGYFGVVTGLNSSATDGSGIYGISYAPRTGAQSYAGVSGYNASTSTDRFGVIGSSNGTTAGSVYSAGVGGYGDYGVLGYSSSNTGAGIIAQHSAGNTALEINNGFLKVSGTNKTAFVVTTVTGNGGNTSGNNTAITYLNPLSTDMVIVTHNWQGNYIGAIGVYFSAGAWRLFREDLNNMPNGEKFNIMVIRQ